MFARFALVAALCSAGCAAQPASLHPPAPVPAHPWVASCGKSDEWDRPAPPFKVFGNTWFVGTCGITALLVEGAGGLVLIDSGTDKGADVVLSSIRSLGFDPRRVTTILMSHEHFDHVGGMAKLQAATGAQIVATPAAARVLRSGRPGPDDPQERSGHPPFPSVTGAIREIRAEKALTFGGVSFTPMLTPGHTPGATSWTWSSCEGRTCKRIVYADSLNPISSEVYRFSDQPALVAAFRAGIAKVAAARCDIVLAPHPAAVQMRERLIAADLASGLGAPCETYARAKAGALELRLAKEASVAQ